MVPIMGSRFRFKRRFDWGRGDADPSDGQRAGTDGFLAGQDVRFTSRWQKKHWRNGLNRRRSPSVCLLRVRRVVGTVDWTVYIDEGTQACEAPYASCIRNARLRVAPCHPCGIVLPSVHNDVPAFVNAAESHCHDAFYVLCAPQVNLSTSRGHGLPFESNKALVGYLEPGSEPTFDRMGFPFKGDLIGNSSRFYFPFGRPRAGGNPVSSRASESRVAFCLHERTPWRTRCVRKKREMAEGRSRIGKNEAKGRTATQRERRSRPTAIRTLRG